MVDKLSKVSLAITGASGVQYGIRLLEKLLGVFDQVFLMVSDAARSVMNIEMGLQYPKRKDEAVVFFEDYYGENARRICILDHDEWTSPVASGSSDYIPMVVCPASMGTLSAVAIGASNNLIERAADVAIKEQRKLILVPRETPYSEIHLRHMLSLVQMGVTILPASPGFYFKPESIDDLIDFVVDRILFHLDAADSNVKKWGS